MWITKVQSFVCLFTFSLGIASVNGFSTCLSRTFSFTADTFTRTVRPYTYRYANNDWCYWRIKAYSTSRVVRLTFSFFNLEYSTYCNNDYFSVYDGSSSLSPLIGKYCGGTIPPMIVSKGQYLYLKFKSNLLVNGLGFTMSYSAIYPYLSTSRCSNSNTFANNNNIKYTASSGYINSPSYPSNYPTNMQCTWKIAVPSGKRIKLYFNYISIAWSLSCTNDYLRIRDGYNSNSPIKGDYCGTTRRTIYSSGRYLWLRFRSNYITGAKGFQLHYTTESISSGSSTGIIVGVILGIAMIVGVIVAIIYCQKKKRPGVVHSTAAPSAITTTTVTTRHPVPPQNISLQPVNHAPPPYENPQKVPAGSGYGGSATAGGPGYAGPHPAGGLGYAGPLPPVGPGYAGPLPAGGPGYAGPPPAGGPGYAGPPLTGGLGYSAYPHAAAGQGYPGPPPQGYQGPPDGNYPGQPLVGGPGPPPVV